MCIFFTPRTGVPWVPTISLIQQVADFQVGERVKQWLLGANVELATGNCPFVPLGVVVDPIDLEKATIRPMVPFCYMSDVAVLVNGIAPTTIWTPTRLSQDDFGKFLVRIFGPASLGG